MTRNDGLQGIISQARKLYYSGKYDAALQLLDQALETAGGMVDGMDEQEQKVVEQLSQELELTSLYFAVQSIFLYNINASRTVSLISLKLEEVQPGTAFFHDLRDLLGLAYYYLEMSKADQDFSTAEELVSSTLTYREREGSPKLAYSHFHMGLIRQYGGKVADALESFQLANQTSMGDAYLLSFITRHLGSLLQQGGKLREAKTLFEQSLQLRLDHDIMVYVPFSCVTLGDLYLQLEQGDRAVQLYEKAVDIGELIGQDRALALAHLSLGRYYRGRDELELAKVEFLDSYHHARKIDHLGIVNHIADLLTVRSPDSSE